MTETGFTAFLCVAPGCGHGDSGSSAAATLAALRSVVAAGRHGVLVCTGCLPGAGFCAARATAPIVLVQPCDIDRRPTTSAVLVGPLRTDTDIETLAAWLRRGCLDPGRLPGHLLDVHRRATAAPRG